ncbi:MAG: transcription termination factor Rho [Planctomycetota bacterium]|jgi:transcription termination factor Rho
MAYKKRKRTRPFHGGQHGGKGGGTAMLAPSYVPARLDYDTLPADLNAEELEELEQTLPATRRKTKPKASHYAELVAMSLGELYEVAEEEKIEAPGRKRDQVIFAIVKQRLEKRIPIIVEGCLEVMNNGHGFLRSNHHAYLSQPEDVYVPPSLTEKFSMHTGMTLIGEIRLPREGETQFAVVTVDTIDGDDPEKATTRTPFTELVPIYPEERMILEGAPENPMEMRIADLVTPMGRGQRGLIVAPPRTGKTVLLHQIANSIVANNPEVHLMIVLLDERPEEVTDFERSIPGDGHEVVSSTFDEPSARHLKVAQMVIDKARSMVEAGKHVAILLDSITRLARASNNEAPSNGKLLSGGLEATALQFPKRFFGSARNIEDGGSLTILGTALVETGSKMDEVIFEEFKGTGNMELVLERRLSDRRIFPAIDINRSGTRKEELLFNEEEIKRVWMLLKVLNELDPVEAMEMLLSKMRKTKINAEFLLTIGS